jgi:hypothetical protein
METIYKAYPKFVAQHPGEKMGVLEKIKKVGEKPRSAKQVEKEKADARLAILTSK